MSATLAARAVSFSYPKGFQVGPVDLSLAPGRIVALVGNNGAGKTTLIRLLAGLLPPAQGEIHLNGRPATRATLRQEVALAPTEPAFPARATVLDLLRLRSHHLRVDPQDAAARLEAQLGRPLATLPARLSRGQRIQVALHLAFLGDPPVVLADEPWSGLDPLAQDDTVKLLAERGETSAVLISSHDLGNLAEVAHEFIFLHHGTVRFRGSLEAAVAAAGAQLQPPAALKVLFRQIQGGALG
jgi:ABC-type multidrug transport system ATPase subunit